jgi:hypothetical protein
METHVKVLGLLHIILGAFGVMAAIVVFMVFGGAAGIVGATAEEGAELAVPIIGMVGSFIVFVILVLSVPGIIIGVGLLKFRNWARILGIVLSVLELVHVPLGTIVAIYGLWVLLTGDTEKLFAAKNAA